MSCRGAGVALCIVTVLACPAAVPTARLPVGPDILFWPPAKRARVLGHMERTFTGVTVPAGPARRRLGDDAPLPLPIRDAAAFMTRQHAAGLLVLQDGRVRLARYTAGFGPRDRWASFSLTNSVTSTLIGAAIHDGTIRSLDDRVASYLPAMTTGAYGAVTIRQLLTMRTGVAWNEDYTDPASDVARLYLGKGADRTMRYMRRLDRTAPPGTAWHYDTGEADLAGDLVRSATGQTLSTYFSRRLRRFAGMTDQAFWATDSAGRELGGSGLSMTLADEARFGQLALDGGRGLVPADWFAAATRDAGGDDQGYGMGWWALSNDRFAALGIFGQAIVVDRPSRVVVVIAAAWPTPTDATLSADRTRFIDQVVAAATPRPISERLRRCWPGRGRAACGRDRVRLAPHARRERRPPPIPA